MKKLKLFLIFAMISFIPWAYIFYFTGLGIQTNLLILQLIGIGLVIVKHEIIIKK